MVLRGAPEVAPRIGIEVSREGDLQTVRTTRPGPLEIRFS